MTEQTMREVKPRVRQKLELLYRTIAVAWPKIERMSYEEMREENAKLGVEIRNNGDWIDDISVQEMVKRMYRILWGSVEPFTSSRRSKALAPKCNEWSYSREP